MLDLDKIEKVLKKNKSYLKEHFFVEKIGVFGSYSKGVQTKDSDIDILVEFNGPIGWKFYSLKDYLEQILKKKVDLATENSLREEMKQDILKNVIYV